MMHFFNKGHSSCKALFAKRDLFSQGSFCKKRPILENRNDFPWKNPMRIGLFFEKTYSGKKSNKRVDRWCSCRALFARKDLFWKIVAWKSRMRIGLFFRWNAVCKPGIRAMRESKKEKGLWERARKRQGYEVARVSRIDKIIRLFCRILSLL